MRPTVTSDLPTVITKIQDFIQKQLKYKIMNSFVCSFFALTLAELLMM